jgi:hypothetical protein
VKKLIVLAAFVFGLAGCATAPTAEDLANADYGVMPDNYAQIINGHLQRVLKDPYSAQIREIHGPRKTASPYLDGTKYGYGVCYAINAKNSMGGYTGVRSHFFLINNGQVTRHLHARGGSYDIAGQAATRHCGE